jgi:phenylacetate-coenzyme A ligase PaaK-like adenylate-forming protein
VAAPWDQRSPAEQRRVQNVMLRQTILQMAIAYVPYVRTRLAAAGIDARLFRGIDELHRIPPTMRRDVFDRTRNPDGARGLILRGTAEGVKRFSDRGTLMKVMLTRLLAGEDEHNLAIESATRALHLHLAPGPGGRIPVAYTRDDLDLFARAGARLASLVGLERHDRLLNLVPFGPTLDFWGIYYMAHGSGMSTVHFQRTDEPLAGALDVFDDARATAVAVPADEAAGFPEAAKAEGVNLSELRVLIAVGRSLTADERSVVGEALMAEGATDARIAAAYAPAEGRVLWGECSVPAGRAETFGFHTYPDLEAIEVLSPETGERVADHEPGEIVVTPLMFRGGGAPRWRTGDLALGGLTPEPCPNCGRTVPRVGPSVVRDAWLREVALDGKRARIDLRDLGAAAAERARDWQVELERDGGVHHLTIYLAAGDDPAPLIDMYDELARVRARPSQIVLASPDDLRRRWGLAPAPWRRYWERNGSAPAPAPRPMERPADRADDLEDLVGETAG